MRIGDKFTALRRDDYDTPVEAWDLLLDKMKTIPKKIWAPFYNNGSLKDKLKARNIPIIHMKKDFFTYEPKEWDVVIDNPSYSNKKAIFERLKSLNKPFALLVPIDTLERSYFKEVFGHCKKLQVIIPSKRNNFTGYDNNNNVPFKAIWVCYGLDLKSKNQLIFE